MLQLIQITAKETKRNKTEMNQNRNKFFPFAETEKESKTAQNG